MLVLSRKVGQRIEIGDGVTIVVTQVTGNRVVIGIEAPRDIVVRRSELYFWQRYGFSIATAVDFPLIQALLVGLGIWATGVTRRKEPADPASVEATGMPSGNNSVNHPATRSSVRFGPSTRS